MLLAGLVDLGGILKEGISQEVNRKRPPEKAGGD
jgi:hypothetical protein